MDRAELDETTLATLLLAAIERADVEGYGVAGFRKTYELEREGWVTGTVATIDGEYDLAVVAKEFLKLLSQPNLSQTTPE